MNDHCLLSPLPREYLMLEIDPQPHRNYMEFKPTEWGQLHTPVDGELSADILKEQAGLLETVTTADIDNAYRPLVDFILLSYANFKHTKKGRCAFLKKSLRSPFIIGFAGSVGVGKSTTARILQRMVGHALQEQDEKVQLITTDGFLYPNQVLKNRNLMSRKGFPESYDYTRLLNFLFDVRSGEPKVEAPQYSHAKYDVIDDEHITVEQPDILIVEGLNILQTNYPGYWTSREAVSDYFDFSLYLDADADIIEDWYIARFLKLQQEAKEKPEAYFYKYHDMNESEARAFARKVWNRVNLPNLIQNIAPTKHRADVILEKSADHSIGAIKIRNTL